MKRSILFLLAAAVSLLPTAILAQTAADASGPGPFTTTSSEYKLPAAVDPDVATELATELWARVYRPVTLSAPPHPLVVLLHGNHATCGRFSGAGQGRRDDNVLYTFTGTCPPTHVPVPSHEGYAYFAERLASWGYVVVSINANRGVNAAPGVAGDAGLNLRRGRLVLKHLQRLSEWNRTAGTTPPSLGFDLFGKLDFAHVGLLGHSRGGEGMRAAYNIYRDPGSPWPARIGPVVFEGIFEIGPVDGQTGRVLNPVGTAWNVLLPLCDGDVFNLQGVRPFDRTLLVRSETPATPKSTFTVWGTNHNFYNTEWQESDSAGCFANKRLFPQLLGSAEQRQASLVSVLNFFRAHVGAGADPAFGALFNPQFELPASLTDVTRIDRGYTDSADAGVTLTFDDFDQPTGINTYGTANQASGVSVAHGQVANHSSFQRVAQVAWNGAGTNVFFQSNWTAAGSGRDVSGFRTLDFRVSRQCGDPLCTKPSNWFNFETNFSVRLVGAGGDVSAPVQLQDYLSLTGPAGGLVRQIGSSPHPILQTARVPLTAFAGVSLASIRGVRFTFDDTRRDEIFIGNIRLSNVSSTASVAAVSPVLAGDDSPLPDPGVADDNKIQAIHRRNASTSSSAGIDITLSSNRAFLPTGLVLTLQIGPYQFEASQYPSDGRTSTVTFSLTAEEWSRLRTNMKVAVGRGPEMAEAWSFGSLDTNLLN